MDVLVKSQLKHLLPPDLLARFVAIVGEKYAITDPQMQESYLVEMRDLFLQEEKRDEKKASS